MTEEQSIEAELIKRELASRDSSTPEPQTQDQQIAQRPSAIADLIKNPTTMAHPLGALLRTMGGAAELYQGVPASIGMDLQAGKPQDILGNLGKVVTGQRPAQYGDVYKGAGVPAPLAAAGGLYTDTVLAPGGAEGIKAVGSGAKALIGGASNKVGGAIGRVIDSFKGASSADLKAKLAQHIADIQKEKDSLDSLFTQKAADITFKGKQVIPQISKGMSEGYEKGLEDIFTKLEDPIQVGGILKKNAPAITNTELIDNLEALVNKTANDPLIVKSKAYQQTVQMLDDFKNGLKSESGLVDASGKTISSPAPEAVDIKDLIGKLRSVKATIKASTQAGNTPVSATDYFATQFNKTVGRLLKDRVEGFKELQASYAPMANTRKVAYKIFKPFSDEDSTAAFLNRVKNNNLKAADSKLLKFIQEGGQVGDKKIPGMGQFAPELKNIGNRLKEIKGGAEEKQLAADIFKKASDEGFRNKLFLWTLGGVTGSAGIKKGADFLIHH